jgi:hypothetical protein
MAASPSAGNISPIDISGGDGGGLGEAMGAERESVLW